MRSYNMQLIIVGADPDLQDAIQEAAEELWGFDDWYTHGPGEGEDSYMEASGDDQLGGGTGEDEFACRLAAAVWRANGGPCRIVVRSTYLDDLPCETFEFDEDDHRRIMAQSAETEHAGG